MAEVSSWSSLPWLWVIESLASDKDLNMSLLNGLIAQASGLSDDLGKNARERVALRCLEDLFDPSQEDGDLSSTSQSKAKFDLSETCENVLHKIVSEVPSSDLRMTLPGQSKWDVQPFIMHKKASLPKCALELLKDELIRGSHPSVYFLRGRSGMLFEDENNSGNGTGDMEQDPLSPTSDVSAVDHWNIIKAGTCRLTFINPENVNGILPEDSPCKIVSSSKMDLCDTTDHNLVGQNLEDIWRNNQDFNPNTKRHKLGSSYRNSLVDQESVPMRSNEQLESIHGKATIHSDEQCKLTEESRLQGLERIRCAENVHDFSKRSLPISDDSDIEAHHNQLPLGNDKIPRGASNGHCKAKAVNEASAYTEHGVRPNASNNATLNRTKRKNFADEPEDDYEDNDIASDSGDYNIEKLELAAMTLFLLSSQCTSDDDPLSTKGSPEQNLCMKCNRDGQVLNCFATDCPVTIHENCLGSSFNFYDDGNFYCPFCTYSRSISKYLEAKKNASHARKTLSAFISSGSQRTDIAPTLHRETSTNSRPQRGVSPVIHNPKNGKAGQTSEPNNRRQSDDQLDNHQTRETVETGDRNNNQPIEGADDEQPEESPIPSVEHNAPQGEKRETIINRTPYRNASKNQVGEQRQQKLSADPTPNGDSSSHTDKETFVLNRIVGSKREVLERRVKNTPQRLAHELESDGKGTSEDIDSYDSANYFVSFRSRKKPNPMFRRKHKWTAEEEEMLKEGVLRFASSEVKSMPWKQILEFGSTIFEKTRTAVDLKDKWRNMCK